MSTTRQRVSMVGRARFELDRLELVDGERYELEGRWFDVRGRRFMRPTLMMVVDGAPVRLLADLADKPWATEEGEPWSASFPYSHDRGELVEAELSVAPDITIDLPVPSGRRRRQPDRPSPEQARAAAEQARAAARIDELLGELSRAVHERNEAQAARDELARRLEALEEQRAEVEAERDTAQGRRDEVARERDAALRARDDALRARDAARQEAGDAVDARDASLADRGAAVAAGTRAESERNSAVAALQRAEAERDSALSLRDHALAERDAALAALDDALVDRDSLARAHDQVQSELSHQISSHGAAMVMRRAVQEPPAFERHAGVLPRAIVVIALLAIMVALLIVLHVV
jgi:hypothetical protein